VSNSNSSNRRPYTRIALAVFCAFAALPSFLRGAAGQELQNRATTVHDFLKAAYPSLFGKQRYMKISISQPIDESWRQIRGIQFEVTPLPTAVPNTPRPLDPNTGKPVPPPQNLPILRGSIVFDDAGHIVSLSATNSEELMNTKQNDDIEKLIESHPEWSDQTDYEELKKAGALYGPADKAQFTQSIRLIEFEKAFGGHLDLKTVEFGGPSPSRVGSFGLLYWAVGVEARYPDGNHYIYLLTYEPFGGRLLGLQRVAPRHYPKSATP